MIIMWKRILIICLLSNNLWAECEPTIPHHFPSQTPDNYYGNSRTDTFNCAVSGTNSLTKAQIDERADLLPESVYNRFYVRLGGNFAAEGVTGAGIVNDASNVTIAGAQIQTTQVKTASNNIEFAFGY